MKRSRRTLLLMAAVFGGVVATAAGEVNETMIKHSSFDARSVARNPFLPIGWSGHAQTSQAPVSVKFNADAFKVTSIVVDGQGGLAIINGNAYGPGDFVSTEINGRPVKIRVKEVRDGEVVLFHDGKAIVTRLVAK